MQSSQAVAQLCRGMRLSTRQIRAAIGPAKQFQRISPYSTRPSRATPGILATATRQPILKTLTQRRFESTTRDPRPLTESPENPEPATPRAEVPSYELTFTCKPCSTRSTHKVSKQGYHKGTVLISCPGCQNRHIIADHLRIFMDKNTTLEDILNDKGEALKKGSIGVDRDMEFWEDGTVTERKVDASDVVPNELPGN